MISNKVTPKIRKTINKFGVGVEAFRKSFNEFNEPIGEYKISDFKGLFLESNISVRANISDSGLIKKDKPFKLIVLINEDTKALKDNDILYSNNEKFTIIDINNTGRLNIYYELTLEKI